MQVKDKTEAELKDLGHICDILNTAEEKLQGFQEKLMYWERISAQKGKNPRELQVQVPRTQWFFKDKSKKCESLWNTFFPPLLVHVPVKLFPLFAS